MSDVRYEKQASACSVQSLHREDSQLQLNKDYYSCGPETVDLPVEVIRNKAPQVTQARKARSEKHRQREDAAEVPVLVSKPSHIPR